MGCGIFPSLAQAPALATGPALKQEERKCPVSGGRRGRADATAKCCALGGCGFGPGPALGAGSCCPVGRPSFIVFVEAQ